MVKNHQDQSIGVLDIYGFEIFQVSKLFSFILGPSKTSHVIKCDCALCIMCICSPFLSFFMTYLGTR